MFQLVLRSSLTLCLLLCCSWATAAKPGGGGGGTTTTNNLQIALDEFSGTLKITGDGGANMAYVTISPTEIRVSRFPWNQTTLNGGTSDYIVNLESMTEVTLAIDLLAGNDRLWVNVQGSPSPGIVHASLGGGDGADEIAVFSETGTELNGDLQIFGGKGDDSISVDRLDLQSACEVLCGDGNDTVSISDTAIFGNCLLSGDRGRDSLMWTNVVTWSGSDVSGFETLLAQ